MHYQFTYGLNFQLHLTDHVSVFFESNFRDGAEILLNVLENDTEGSSYGKKWDIAEGIVRSGVNLVGWPAYFDRLRAKYDELLDGRPYYRDIGHCTNKARRAAMWDRHDLRWKLEKTRYLPEEMVMPNFIEGGVIRPSLFRELAVSKATSIDSVYEYFLRSFDSQQITIGQNVNFSDVAWCDLIDAGLVVSGSDIPVDVAISLLSMSEIHSILSLLKIRLERSKEAAIAMLDISSERVRTAIDDCRDWEDVFCILPPPSLDWQDFQSARQQIKGMAVALVDLYDGTLRRKNRDDFQLLCGLD